MGSKRLSSLTQTRSWVVRLFAIILSLGILGFVSFVSYQWMSRWWYDPMEALFLEEDYVSIPPLFNKKVALSHSIEPVWWFYTGVAYVNLSLEEASLVNFESSILKDEEGILKGVRFLMRAWMSADDTQKIYIEYLLGRAFLYQGPLYYPLAIDYLLKAQKGIETCSALCLPSLISSINLYLGLAYLRSEDYEKGQVFLESFYSQQADITSFSLLLRSYLLDFSGEKALALLHDFTHNHPKMLSEMEADYLRILSLRAASESSQALSLLVSLIEKQESAPFLYQLIANIYAELGQDIQARYYRRQMLDLESSSIWETSRRKLGQWIFEFI